jgi:hypothetical protein
MDYYTLLETSIATTLTAYDTLNGRKISDYDFLIFGVIENGYFRNTVLIPTSIFVTGAYKVQIDYSSMTSNRWCEFSYSTDTLIKAYAANSGVTGKVMGYKIVAR